MNITVSRKYAIEVNTKAKIVGTYGKCFVVQYTNGNRQLLYKFQFKAA